jgi:hypothetical protein
LKISAKYEAGKNYRMRPDSGVSKEEETTLQYGKNRELKHPANCLLGQRKSATV